MAKILTESAIALRKKLLERGYDEHFCELIAYELNGEWTAGRMLGYLSHFGHLSEEDVVDEMLAILSDRERIVEHKRMIETQSKWNEFLLEGFEEEGE